MEILLEKLNELEKNVQKLSVIDKEKYNYFQQKIQELRNKLIKLENTAPVTLQQETDKIIIEISRLKIEFSNYMETGNIERIPGKLFFELPEQDNTNISGNEKIKRHRLGLLSSTVELVKKDTELDFNKLQQIITKFNAEKNNTEPGYSPIQIDYIDRLITELFIEYQRKYYQKNGTLPLEEPSTYCNMDTYEAMLRVMASEKLIEEKDRIRQLEGLVLDGQIVNNDEIWNMISGKIKGKEGAITNSDSLKKQNESPSNQLIPVKARKRINNDLILSIRKKNIFGNLIEKTKRIKLGTNGSIEIPKEMRLSIVRAILPEGITRVSQWAFMECINLSEVLIPESVTVIESNAFIGCSNLKDIKLPDNLTHLYSECFRNSGLQSIEIPENVIEIGTQAFCGCNYLRRVVLKEGLKKIGTEAFLGAYIEKIRIPDSVQIVGKNSLECHYLEEISLPKTLEDVNINSICGSNIPQCIIRGKDIVPTTNKESISRGRITDRERD